MSREETCSRFQRGRPALVSTTRSRHREGPVTPRPRPPLRSLLRHLWNRPAAVHPRTPGDAGDRHRRPIEIRRSHDPALVPDRRVRRRTRSREHLVSRPSGGSGQALRGLSQLRAAAVGGPTRLLPSTTLRMDACRSPGVLARARIRGSRRETATARPPSDVPELDLDDRRRPKAFRLATPSRCARSKCRVPRGWSIRANGPREGDDHLDSGPRLLRDPHPLPPANGLASDRGDQCRGLLHRSVDGGLPRDGHRAAMASPAFRDHTGRTELCRLRLHTWGTDRRHVPGVRKRARGMERRFLRSGLDR